MDASMATAERTLVSTDGTVVAIFREATLLERLGKIIAETQPPPGATGHVVIAGMGDRQGSRREIGVSDYLPDWTLALELDGSNPFESAASRQAAIYICTAIVGIIGIGLVAAFVARAMRREMRLTELKNDLLSTVSHEFKTPVASMRLLVDTLLEGRVHEPEKVREYLELLSTENARLSRLVDNFLTFSRLERQEHRFEFRDVELNDVVDASLRAYGDRIEREDCRLEVAISENLPPVRADRDALITVILNLLDNAWKYSGVEKRIRLEALALEGKLRLSVSDNGIGIHSRALRKVFDRFHQLDQSLTRDTGGFGIGLSIVKSIVDGHGGEISVRSQPGEGSTFTVELPVGSESIHKS
jgi:two-component system phosphate regulon sensor histidine kinase PhoR